MMVNDEEIDLFLQEMGDVKPLQLQPKVAIKRSTHSELALEARRQAATQEVVKDSNHLSSDHVDLLDPYYVLEFKRAGVQNGVFRKLKQGRYTQEARLDLHRMTVAAARKEVFEFVKECSSYDLRSLIIVHGKGNHGQRSHQSPKGDTAAALLKSYVNKWLPDLAEVQAYCSAQPQHGGVGAVYVLLRKSEKKKQENRDRITRGRTVAD
ncbi:MAG: DNA endonuclease SmrA [Spongiibacteraceae bacterium]|jgi:DNA-nicking Smr family endonuclease